MNEIRKLIEDIIVQKLNESSLSRIWSQTRKHDFGTITAFRSARDCGVGEKYTKSENLKRNKSLLSKLIAKGYGVTKIKGSYIENYGSSNAKEVGENSFMVIDLKDSRNLRKDLLSLGEEFEQDSIIFGKAGSPGILIGTNKCAEGYPGYHKEVLQGGAVFGKTGQFMSRVKGRPFIFSESVEIEEYAVPKYPSEFRGPVAQSKMKWEDFSV
jgi:hypothetical protein